jgi:dihydroneopterin aldolase
LRDLLQLQVHDIEVEVLTGIYSEETHLPQPLRISISADIDIPEHFAPDTPLSASKSYIDLKHAATTSLPEDVHFTLIEAVAEHICDTLFISASWPSPSATNRSASPLCATGAEPPDQAQAPSARFTS